MNGSSETTTPQPRAGFFIVDHRYQVRQYTIIRRGNQHGVDAVSNAMATAIAFVEKAKCEQRVKSLHDLAFPGVASVANKGHGSL